MKMMFAEFRAGQHKNTDEWVWLECSAKEARAFDEDGQGGLRCPRCKKPVGLHVTINDPMAVPYFVHDPRNPNCPLEETA